MVMDNATCPVCCGHKDGNGNCFCPEPFDLGAIPQEKTDGIARTIFPHIVSFFQVPENQARFESWLIEYEKKKLAKAEVLVQAT